MKIIRPTIITDALLTSCNVAEDDYAEFSMGATYGAGDRVIDSTGLEILTLDVAPATEWAAGDLITGQSSGKTCRAVRKLTALTYQVRERTGSFTLGEVIGVTGVGGKLADQGAAHPTITAASDRIHKIYEAIPNVGVEVLTLDVAPATAWTEGRTLTGQTSGKTCVVITRLTDLTYLVRNRNGEYALGEIIGVTGIAAELADQGAANPVFAIAPNTARYPAIDLLRDVPAYWSEAGATNRWRAFDRKVGSQTGKTDLISYLLTPGAIDSIALLNLDASTATLTMTVNVGNWDDIEELDLISDIDGGLIATLYNSTINLISTLGIVDAWTYFFEPIVRRPDIVRMDLPPYSTGVLSIAIANSGGTALVGEIVVGAKRDIGATLYTPSVGIVDYSRKAADENGNFDIAEGPYSKRYTCSLRIRNTSLDEIFRLLALYRATPLVWVAVEEYASFIAYGKFNDFNIELANTIHSLCSLEIEGLT